MKSILIIDDQKWVKDLCREAYDPNMYCLKATEDVEKAMTDIKVMKNFYSIKG
jgi:hypothetical protein